MKESNEGILVSGEEGVGMEECWSTGVEGVVGCTTSKRGC